MKIIIAGATGFIGEEVLSQALAHPAVGSVIALSRRPIGEPYSANPKLRTVLMSDETYVAYTPEILSQLAGAAGCVWALGVAVPKDVDSYRRVNVEYARAAVETFARELAGKSEEGGAGDCFRFAYCSGMLAVRNQGAATWFLGQGRKIRGEAENAIIKADKDFGDKLDAFVLRPGMVLSRRTSMINSLLGGVSVRVQDVAAALLEDAMYGGGPGVEENSELSARGRKFLEKQNAASK